MLRFILTTVHSTRSVLLPMFWCTRVAIDMVRECVSCSPSRLGSPRYHTVNAIMLLLLGNLIYSCKEFLKKNQNAPRPSEYPPVMGKKMSKRLGAGIKGCKYKTSSWLLNRFPDADNIGSTV